MIDKYRLARAFRRFPQIGFLFTMTYRLTQPRLTAGVAGVLLDDQNRVLLLEHVFHARLPWGLPGGWLGRKEEPALAIAREFREETGLTVDVVRPIMVVQDRQWRAHLDISYLLRAEHPIPPLELSYEIVDYGWFKLDELPPVNRYNRLVLAAVSELLEAGNSV
jgi:ADP-ribose pyrophosphatase YjhB (NUDIX family)